MADARPASLEPRLEEVDRGIFAYIQPDGTWFLNNAGFIVGPDGLLAIDSTSTERRARALREALRSVSDAPVQVLVNTHSHGDHTWGNFVFAPATAIVAHERCRAEALAASTGATALFPDVEWGELRLAPPFVTFEERLNLYAGDLRIELHYLGPAHTTGDVVAWIPERRVLFTGDLVFNGGTPLALTGTVRGWVEVMPKLRAFGAERIVPGHGPVCGPEAFDAVEGYLRFVLEAAERGLQADVEPLELARDLDLGPYRELTDPERLVANLHRAYADLRGEPPGSALDAARIFQEMVAYNGGQPLRCLA